MSGNLKENHIFYDEKEDEYYYIGFLDQPTDDWVSSDLVDDPWDWVIDDDIPFDVHDLEEFFNIINSNETKSSEELVNIINNFLDEKGIKDILREKGIEYKS